MLSCKLKLGSYCVFCHQKGSDEYERILHHTKEIIFYPRDLLCSFVFALFSFPSVIYQLLCIKMVLKIKKPEVWVCGRSSLSHREHSPTFNLVTSCYITTPHICTFHAYSLGKKEANKIVILIKKTTTTKLKPCLAKLNAVRRISWMCIFIRVLPQALLWSILGWDPSSIQVSWESV